MLLIIYRIAYLYSKHKPNFRLEFLEQYSEVFNSMFKQVLSGTDTENLNSMLDSDKLTELLSQAVKVDTSELLIKQMSFLSQQA